MEHIDQLSALAHEGRLAVFRLLVKAGPEGMPAGDIAASLDTAPNTMSAQLSILAGAGLINSHREGRSIIYAANLEAISQLTLFLLEDCCDGRPEICAPVSKALSARAC